MDNSKINNLNLGKTEFINLQKQEDDDSEKVIKFFEDEEDMNYNSDNILLSSKNDKDEITETLNINFEEKNLKKEKIKIRNKNMILVYDSDSLKDVPDQIADPKVKESESNDGINDKSNDGINDESNDGINDETKKRIEEERIAKLDETEAAVYSKYQEMINNIEKGTDKNDAIFKFMDGLSDEELSAFLQAYDYVNDAEGGMEELCCDLYSELLFDKAEDMETKIFTRLANLLSTADKSAIIAQLSKRMDNAVASMTYMRKNDDGYTKTDIPNTTKQNAYRQIFEKQKIAFIALLLQGDTSKIEDFVKQKYTLQYDWGFIIGNGNVHEEHWMLTPLRPTRYMW